MTRSRLRAVMVVAALLCTMAASRAATIIETYDGRTIVGDLIAYENGMYRFHTQRGDVTIARGLVRSMRDETHQPAPSLPPLPAPTPAVAPRAAGVLQLAGSTTVGDELAPALIEAFDRSRGASSVSQTTLGTDEELDMTGRGPSGGDLQAHISRHGSATAFTALADRKADIGMASRRINQQEAARLAALGMGDFTQPGLENVLALDGLLVVVNKTNPISTLSVAQICGVFSGAINDWSQLGGPAGPIKRYVRDSKSGTADTFNSLVMSCGKINPAQVIETKSAEDMSTQVLGDPLGIGYNGFAYLGDTKALNIATECGIVSPPTDTLVRTEEYPLSRRLFLYAMQQPEHPLARDFIDFALSDKGQELARKSGFIDLIAQLAPPEFGRTAIAMDIAALADDPAVTPEDQTRFLQYSKIAVHGQRVTTTFRFQTGSSLLDARAVRDVDRLAAFLSRPVMASRKVLVAGFTDNVGSSASNYALGLNRARSIAALLAAKGVTATETAGFGIVAPVACNTSDLGREKNRRVEIWVY